MSMAQTIDEIYDSDRTYRCSLSNESLEHAQAKLGEYANDRASAVHSLRTWLKNQEWLDTPTDTSFLLSFLRMRKFSQVFARRSVVNYWESRDKFPQWFHNVDTHHPAIQSVLANGSYLALPGHDRLGRRVLLGRPGILDTSKTDYTCDDFIKTGFALSDYWLMDEMTQVHGFVVFMDFTGLGLRHQSFVGLSNLMNNTSIMTKIYPIRTQEVHQFNMGKVGETVYSVARPFLPYKVKERMFIHTKLSTVYDHIDKSMLPDEYLEDDYDGPSAGPVDELTDKLVAEMSSPEVRSHLLELSCKRYRINEKLRPVADDQSLESFRKLSL